MGLGFQFTGRLQARGLLRRTPAFGAWVRELLAVFEAVHPGFVERASVPEGDDGDAAEFVLHPAAEALFVERGADGVIVVSAKTSNVGPGYHVFLVETLTAFFERTRFEIERDEEASFDEAGVRPTGDIPAAEREAREWLRGLAQHVGRLIDDGATQLVLALPMDRRFEGDGAVLTVLGPRDRAWLDDVASGRDDGASMVPWWQPGFGAEYWRGRVLVRMWSDVRWRAPLDDGERAELVHVHDELARAHAADPRLPLPVREWRELAELVPDVIRVPHGVVDLASSAPIGYRRRPVKYVTEGWSITVPGDFADTFEGDGSTLLLFDATRSVRVTTFTATRDDGSPVPAAKLIASEHASDRTPIEIPLANGVLSKASIGDSATDGEAHRLLSGCAAVDGRLVIATITHPDASDDAWARAVFATLTNGR
jgi:hypothetical protein